MLFMYIVFQTERGLSEKNQQMFHILIYLKLYEPYFCYKWMVLWKHILSMGGDLRASSRMRFLAFVLSWVATLDEWVRLFPAGYNIMSGRYNDLSIEGF